MIHACFFLALYYKKGALSCRTCIMYMGNLCHSYRCAMSQYTAFTGMIPLTMNGIFAIFHLINFPKRSAAIFNHRGLIFWCVFLFSPLSFTAQGHFTSSNLPIIAIDTHGKTIRNHPRITATMGIINNGAEKRNTPDDEFNGYDGRIAIEIRGSSGQWKDWPKEHYGFETQTESGENNNVSLLGLPGENDWILYPPYSDKSLMRNVLAYQLSRDIGRYAPRTVFCELWLNGDYRGVYVLIEKIKRDDNRIDIATLRPEDIEGDQLTGGYVIKVDRSAGENNEGWESPYQISPTSDRWVPWLYHDPGPDELTVEQKQYIKDYILEFETAMWEAPSYAIVQHYLDIDSFIDYYLINELSKNIDTWTFSTFFYKDRDSKGGKLTFGPVWDINLGFGNADYFVGMETTGWLLRRKIEVNDRIPFWLTFLDNHRGIQEQIAGRWQELRRDELALERILAHIDDWAEWLGEAQQRNFVRWPILGTYVWPNFIVGETFEDEVNYLKQWLTDRWQWMDAELGRLADINNPDADHVLALEQNVPNPFNSSTRISYRLNQPQHIKLDIINAIGKHVKTLVDSHRAAGLFSVEWDGSNAQGEPVAGGVYFYRSSSQNYVITRKLLLLP